MERKKMKDKIVYKFEIKRYKKGGLFLLGNNKTAFSTPNRDADEIETVIKNIKDYEKVIVIIEVNKMKAELEEEVEKLYIKYQKASGLKVGDKVKVLRKARDHENGWTNGWISDMDLMVGNTYVIDHISDWGGVTLKEWGFPFFVLEKISPKTMEYLNHLGKWVKSKNEPEEIQKYEELILDNKYDYFHNAEMLYRQKKEE